MKIKTPCIPIFAWAADSNMAQLFAVNKTAGKDTPIQQANWQLLPQPTACECIRLVIALIIIFKRTTYNCKDLARGLLQSIFNLFFPLRHGSCRPSIGDYPTERRQGST